MESEKLVKSDLADRPKKKIHDSWTILNSFTLSSIRWLQRYSHCYSAPCSLICLPFWILLLPIALSLDLCIYSIVSVVFIIIFLLSLLFSPLLFLFQCSDVCSGMKIYRFSLRNALSWSESIMMYCHLSWWCYCGTGDIESGAPLCCTYYCGTSCKDACHRATHVKMNDQSCTLL